MTMPMTSGSLDSSTTEPTGIFDRLKLSKEEAALAAWANDQYKRMKSDRTGVERQWYTNLAFYFGRQNIQVVSTPSSAGGSPFRFEIPKAPPWRVRLISNKIRPMIRTELAKVTAQKPRAQCIPASSDDNDIFAARAGEQLYDSFYRQKKLKAVLRRTMFWTLICGNGFMKVWWDPETLDENGQPGDIQVCAETPFHIFVPDLREEELENQPYLIHASTKSVDWVKAHYKTKLDGRKLEPNVSASNDILDSAFLNFVGGNQPKNDSCMCLEVWIKPGGHPMFPEGGMFTVLAGEVVQIERTWPYQHNQFPFAKFDHIPTGQFYCDSTIKDLIPLQKEYNRTRSQIIEAKNRMAKPQLLAPQGSVNPSQITTEPGQVILYTPGFQPPTPLVLQNLPPYVLEELNRVQQDMDDISGQHEVTKGRVPPGVTAATAISYLQEQDDSKLSHTVDSLEDGIEKVAHQYLSHVVQYWDVGRIVKVVGNDGAFDALTIKGADLRGNTDIQVEAGSALPTSKAAKQAFVMDLMKMGFIPPDKGLEVLEIGGINKLYDDLQVDLRQAQRENLKLQRPPDPMLALQPPQVDPNTGQPLPPPPVVPINSWDNHAIHIEIHNKFRKSQAFEMLDEQVKIQFEQHVASHEMLVAQQQMSQQMSQMMQQPSGGSGMDQSQAQMGPPEGMMSNG